jgi:hypothetical protein
MENAGGGEMPFGKAQGRVSLSLHRQGISMSLTDQEKNNLEGMIK